MVSEATQHDWEDFWYSPEKFGTWHITDFEKVWKEMDQIEPLTPITDDTIKKQTLDHLLEAEGSMRGQQLNLLLSMRNLLLLNNSQRSL